MTALKFLGDYQDKRIVSVFILGIASGLPWVLIGSALSLWLKESGISRADIGYAGLIFTVYAVNFLWSPLIDRFQLGRLGRYLGRRKAWILPCQLMMALCCVCLSFYAPQEDAKTIVLIALLIALSSSTQDIAIDAYRIDSFDRSERTLISTAAGAATAGWWTGYAGLGFIPLFLSDHGWQWPQLYLLMGACVLAVTIAALFTPRAQYTADAKELNSDIPTYLNVAISMGHLRKFNLSMLLLSPIFLTIWALSGSPGMTEATVNNDAYIPTLIVLGLGLTIVTAVLLTRSMTSTPQLPGPGRVATKFDHILARLLSSLCSPIKNFFDRNGFLLAIYVLLFVFLFKLGEAFLGRMSIVFYKEVGFSNTDIATYSKMLTWWITVVSAFIAGAINARLGIIKGLFISGVFMAASNLMFSWIALVGPSIPLYIAAIVVDGIAAAWSLVAFVAFISAMCDHRFSASQYALLASLGALGRTTLSSLSGQIVDWLDGNWALFFLMTALMVIPSLLLLIKLSRIDKQYFSADS